ncbi:hypothetical protein [Natrinema thermotolerans]
MPGYTLYLTRGGGPPDPNSDDTVVIGPDQIIDPNLPQSHSDVDEWQITVPLTRSLNDWRLAEAFVEYEARDGTTELIYRGRLDTVNHDESSGLTTLRGQSTEYKLKSGSSQQHYQGRVVANVIEEYWAQETQFDATVEEPNPETIDEGKTIWNVSTTAEFEEIFQSALDGTTPIGASNGSLDILQACFFSEVTGGGTSEFSDADFSDGHGAYLETSGGQILFDGFNTLNYTIPGEYVGLALRLRGDSGLDFDIRLNGDTYHSFTSLGVADLDWLDVTAFADWSTDLDTVSSIVLEATSDANPRMEFDCAAVFDTRYFNPDGFDNQVHEPSGYLDSPELYPDTVEAVSETYEEDWNVTAASLQTTIDDTTGEQAFAISNDGGSSFAIEGQNTAAVSGEFASIGSLVQVKVTLSQDEDLSARNQTPRYGYEGQSISDLELTVDTNDLAIYNDREFAGKHFEILSELHKDAGYNWVIGPVADDANLAAHSFPQGSIERSADWTTVEGLKDGYDMRDYANVVTVFGAYDEANSEYLVAEARDEDEIQRLLDLGFTQEEAEVEETVIEPDLDNPDDLRQVARSELASRVAEDQMDATVPIVPTVITPGYSYPIPELEDENGNVPVLPLEELSFQDGADPRGDLKFEDPTDIANVVRGVSTDVRRTKRAIR